MSANPSGPIIRPLPSVDGFIREVDKVIHHDTPDSEIKAFINLIMLPANAEDEHSYDLAMSAARHAFTKSNAFEAAFREFAKLAPELLATADRILIESASDRAM